MSSGVLVRTNAVNATGPILNLSLRRQKKIFNEDLAGTLEQTRERLQQISEDAEKIKETDRRQRAEFSELRDKVYQILQNASQLRRM